MSARFPRGVRSTHYRRGTVLWHGTSHPYGITDLRGPMWVSDSRDVARWFSTWKVDGIFVGPEGEEPRHRTRREVPRILKIEVVEPFSLPTFEARHAHGADNFAGFSGWMAELLDDEELRDGGDMEEFTNALCGTSYLGWRIVMNYQTGDDIMLCNPERYLRRVPARGEWKP